MVSSLISSRSRSRGSTSNPTGRKVSESEILQYSDGTPLYPSEEPTGFGKSESMDTSQRSVSAPEAYAAQVRHMRDPHSSSYEIPNGAIRVDNQVTIDRQEV